MKVIPSARKAQLVDYILLGWQTSTYTLRNSNNRWFMKPYAEIVEETGIPKSTLQRYIKELHDAGFIERRQALFSRTKEQGGFEVKKGNYIHITEKLLALIRPSIIVAETPHEDKKDIQNDSYQQKHSKVNVKPDCADFTRIEGFEPLKMRGLYISNLYSSSLNNINWKKITHCVDNCTHQRLNQQFEAIQQLLYSQIKEEIPGEVKKMVLGTFSNITFQHIKQFSNPRQLAAEYLFVLVNTEFYLPDVICFKHRNNILAKMLRENRWRTPKGFYKHFYLGQGFKDQNELREAHWNEQKNNEIQCHTMIEKPDENYLEYEDEQLIQIETQMREQSSLLNSLMQSIKHQSSEEQIERIREHIHNVRRTLEHLWHQQSVREDDIQASKKTHLVKRCA